jgi:fatty-acyl-CoA synthase
MVLPSSNLQPEAIKILEDEKVTKANGVPTIYSIYDAMKKIHQKRN